ncbi:hypothetical protein ATY81_10085 [Rhizobium sp. R72]|nr:hypothetical protein ATY81_10085 [Rhizobium sp. R72]OWV95813.1 hypothetical protein ATY80_10085 [Rhizobium sp. R711]
MATLPEKSDQYLGERFEAAERNRHAVLLLEAGVGATAAAFVGAGMAQADGILGGFGVGALIVLAGIAVGGFLGFLFSVPPCFGERQFGDPSCCYGVNKPLQIRRPRCSTIKMRRCLQPEKSGFSDPIPTWNASPSG